MPLLRDHLLATRRRLEAAGCDSPNLEAEELFAFVLNTTRGQLLAMRSFDFPAEAEAKLEELLLRRLAREPLAYIIEETAFFSRRFIVREGVLVPRVDTEILVQACLDNMGESGRVLELGVGSGCIITSLLAERSKWQGIALDLSPIALQVTAENAELQGVSERMHAYQGSWYSAMPDTSERFDLIVSNPPYIDPRERSELMPEVGQYEPAMALFAEEQGLAAYQAILADAAKWLAAEGTIALELGLGQAEAVKALAIAAGFKAVETRLDTQGHERVLIAQRTKT